MKVLIEYYCDNGYSCSCCGKDWIETEIVELDDDLDAEEFKAKIDEMNKKVNEEYYSKKEDRYGRHEIISAHVVIHSYEL